MDFKRSPELYIFLVPQQQQQHKGQTDKIDIILCWTKKKKKREKSFLNWKDLWDLRVNERHKKKGKKARAPESE